MKNHSMGDDMKREVVSAWWMEKEAASFLLLQERLKRPEICRDTRTYVLSVIRGERLIREEKKDA